MLELNQIRQVYVWVHPGNEKIPKSLLNEWQALFQVLYFEPRIAVIETSQTEPIRSWEETKDKRISYGQAYHDFKKPRAFWREVGEVESNAAELLGDRYHVWPDGNFIEGDNPEHAEILSKLLNVKTHELFPGRCQKMFVKMVCFGLRPTVCVEHQAYAFGLSNLAHDRAGKRSTPSGLDWTVYPPGYQEGAPSTKESLDYMIEKGILHGMSKRYYAREREKLPSMHDPKARGIIQVPLHPLCQSYLLSNFEAHL